MQRHDDYLPPFDPRDPWMPDPGTDIDPARDQWPPGQLDPSIPGRSTGWPTPGDDWPSPAVPWPTPGDDFQPPPARPDDIRSPGWPQPGSGADKDIYNPGRGPDTWIPAPYQALQEHTIDIVREEYYKLLKQLRNKR
jgi:hypothetical protein